MGETSGSGKQVGKKGHVSESHGDVGDSEGKTKAWRSAPLMPQASREMK